MCIVKLFLNALPHPAPVQPPSTPLVPFFIFPPHSRTKPVIAIAHVHGADNLPLPTISSPTVPQSTPLPILRTVPNVRGSRADCRRIRTPRPKQLITLRETFGARTWYKTPWTGMDGPRWCDVDGQGLTLGGRVLGYGASGADGMQVRAVRLGVAVEERDACEMSEVSHAEVERWSCGRTE